MSPDRLTESFLRGVGEKLGFYVYALRDPRDESIFYVGKGKGDRCYAHARQAKVQGGESPEQLKIITIKEIQANGKQPGIEIVRFGLRDDAEAFEVEASVIDALGLVGIRLGNKIRGQHADRGWRPLPELVASMAAVPIDIAPEHRVMLVRINRQYRPGMSDDDLYESTRKWWVIGKRRRPEYAFAVFNGIVRAVYDVEAWVQGENELRRRRAFIGRRNDALDDAYGWKDVSNYFKRGAQSPIVFVNC